jgi:hypothetical protein
MVRLGHFYYVPRDEKSGDETPKRRNDSSVYPKEGISTNILFLVLSAGHPISFAHVVKNVSINERPSLGQAVLELT